MASVGRLGSRGRFSTSVRLWDAATQEQVAPTGTAHTGEIRAVTSGTYRGVPIFATGSPGLICLWRAEPLPGYSIDREPAEIADPNLCGRVPRKQIHTGSRPHDLGAVCRLDPGRVATWGGTTPDLETLQASRQEWRLQPPGGDGRQVAVAWPPLAAIQRGGVVAVSVTGGFEPGSVVEVTREDGTVRRWVFSLRADWERQSSSWHYWHCVAVEGPVARGREIGLRVDPVDGRVTLDVGGGAATRGLTFDPGCPATQCALGDEGRNLVVFDERGVAHHLELLLADS